MILESVMTNASLDLMRVPTTQLNILGLILLPIFVHLTAQKTLLRIMRLLIVQMTVQ